MTRRVEFVRFTTPVGVEAVCEVFERGGFYDQSPEQCLFRNGVYLLWDPAKCSFVVLVCRNGNGSAPVWQ